MIRCIICPTINHFPREKETYSRSSSVSFDRPFEIWFTSVLISIRLCASDPVAEGDSCVCDNGSSGNKVGINESVLYGLNGTRAISLNTVYCYQPSPECGHTQYLIQMSEKLYRDTVIPEVFRRSPTKSPPLRSNAFIRFKRCVSRISR